jgi:hypothetical protein
MSGGRFRRDPFVIDSDGGTDCASPYDLAQGLENLTILSSVDDTSWLGVGGIPARPPQGPQSAPARAGARAPTRSFSSSLSVASSMTEPPPLRSTSPAGRTRGLGGFVPGGLPSETVNALRDRRGEYRKIYLIHIEASERICFGLIGTRRFCRSDRCRTKAHKGKSSKFVMEAQGGWFIPGKPNLEGTPNAFVAPFLDASKITEDTSYDLAKALTSRTTPEWERFILDTQEEWEELQVRKLANIQESGDSDDQEDDDEDSGTMWEGKLTLTSPPSDFAWSEDLVTTGVASALLDKGTAKDMDEAVKNLQAAFEDIDELVAESRAAARNDAREILSHIDISVTDIVLAIDRMNQRGRTGWDLIGDIKAMREDREELGLTLVEAVT